MADSPKRKPPSVGTKLAVCLILLGFEPGEDIDWDHFPALALRPVKADGSDWDPPQHDPRYLRPLRRKDHAVKTTGRKGESKYSSNGGGDTSQAAKVKRIEDARRALLAAEKTLPDDSRKARKKSQWPKGRKLESRGFPAKRQKEG